jgi:non-homologous end joining protein Ku
MKKLYKLIFENLTIPVRFGNRVNETKTSFTHGRKCDGTIKQLKQLYVVPKGDAGIISTPDDISEIVPFGSAQTFYVHKEPITGEKQMYEIDKTYLNSLYPNVDDMNVMYKLHKDNIPWHMLDGGHYPLNLNDKLKTSEHDVLYQSLVYGMMKHGDYLVVKFISYKRPRYGLIHPFGNGLCISFVHGSNMLRPYKPAFEQFSYTEDVLNTYSTALFGIVPETEDKTYPYSETMDLYEVELIQYVNDVISGKVRIGDTVQHRPSQPHVGGLLGKLLNLASVKSSSGSSVGKASTVDPTEKIEQYLKDTAGSEMDIPSTPNTYHSTLEKSDTIQQIDSKLDDNPYTKSLKSCQPSSDIQPPSPIIREAVESDYVSNDPKCPFKVDFSKSRI